MLYIKLLGKTRIEYEGKDITEKFGAKTIALLSLLLLNENEQVSREKLIAFLWPDSNEEAGKYNLRFNLWLLKSVIGEDKNGSSFINLDRGFCTINQGYDFKCDLIAVKEANSFENKSIEELETLLKIFTGDFMESFYFKNCNEYNEIILIERSHLDNIRTKLIMKMVELYEEKSDLDNCLNILIELIQSQPYDEEVALKIMEIYDQEGKQSSAVIFYNNFKNRLVTCLGVSPSEQLQEKFMEVTKGKDISKKRKNNTAKLANYPEVIRKDPLIINTMCIEGIQYYWISNLISQINNMEDVNLLEYIGEVNINDLSYINPELQVYIQDGSPLMEMIAKTLDVRIAHSFMKLINNLKKDYYLSIGIEGFQNMDDFSRSILEIIREEDVEIIIK